MTIISSTCPRSLSLSFLPCTVVAAETTPSPLYSALRRPAVFSLPPLRRGILLSKRGVSGGGGGSEVVCWSGFFSPGGDGGGDGEIDGDEDGDDDDDDDGPF